MNLPVFGAAASGLFAEHGLDVALVGPPPRPPITAPAAVDQGPAVPAATGATGPPAGVSVAPSPPAGPDGALEEWCVLEDYVFATGQPLAMTDVQWEATVAHAARTYALTPVPVAELCREEMVGTSTGGRAG